MAIPVHDGEHMSPYALMAHLTNAVNGVSEADADCPLNARLRALGLVEHDGETWQATDHGLTIHGRVTGQPRPAEVSQTSSI